VTGVPADSRGSLPEVPSLRWLRRTPLPCAAPPLMRLPSLSTLFRTRSVARHWFRAPSTTFGKPTTCFRRSSFKPVGPLPRCLEVFPTVPAARLRAVASSGLCPLQGVTTVLAAHLRDGCHEARAHAVPPRVSSSTALSDPGGYVHIRRVYLARLRSAFRVSHPLDGLFRPDPSGLVSSRWRSRGSALQSFSFSKSRCASRRSLPS
jgi:hypothetical protein